MASDYTDTTDTNFKGEPYNIDTGKPLSAAGVRDALHTKEKVANKVTTINNQSTDTQYPSAKVVYDLTVHKDGAQTITGVKTFGMTGSPAEPLLGVAKTTGVTNSGTKFASEAQVYSLAQELAAALLPVGTILAMSVSSWTNAGAAFQSKWRVCDGTGGTPNLSGRFLRGGTSTDATIGGANSQSITLQTTNLPSHKHGITDKQHSHSAVTYKAYGNTDAFHFGVGYSPASDKASGTDNTQNAYTGITETNNTGSGTAFTVDTVPSYYTVIYIMKVA
ncbi:MAG: hypothetical protein LBK68_04125 [Candidatus Margulisbacteria bacterium]|nr:hypothetical protein [Candidatus Margulisiibacteriota bacterium]